MSVDYHIYDIALPVSTSCHDLDVLITSDLSSST